MELSGAVVLFFSVPMLLKKIKIMSWNTRGLGDEKKCNVVRNVIRSARCDVCCLQETKWNDFDVLYYLRVLPTFFDRNCVAIKAINTKGGCIIAWKRNFTLMNSWATKHTCSAMIKHEVSGVCFLITNVYGPSTDDGKEEFVMELRGLSQLVQGPWVLGGDFNLVRWLVDRSGDLRSFTLMNLFNDLIRDMQVIDIPLKNRMFTWSSKRPEPVFSKLDRIFVSTEWS